MMHGPANINFQYPLYIYRWLDWPWNWCGQHREEKYVCPCL